MLRETTVVVVVTYAAYACTNSLCAEPEFAAPVPPIYLDLPDCPCCGCPSFITEVLRRDG
jgi:hypothetical protein